jgi:hypothetical protein|tara:strand:- start:203 stop:397 length:195 start_codon:yes stop_codon:yes gene_type:complete
MVLEKHVKDFDSYIDTMNNIKMAIKASTKRGDIDIIIKILKEFSIATDCLVDLLEITKGERITA